MENSVFNKNKVQLIIENLQTQIAANASSDKLLAIAKMLVMELQQTQTSGIEKKNVSVVMPVTIASVAIEEEENISAIDKFSSLTDNQNGNIEEEKIELKKENFADKKIESFNAWNSFDISNEAPTIALYKTAEAQKNELNERYKDETNENVHTQQGMPIHDLTTAVGINDRYLFINELFRGDEFMYERSIITLDRFHNYEQAFSWIERELRLKLGWDLNSSITKQFEQLVRRRFIKK